MHYGFEPSPAAPPALEQPGGKRAGGESQAAQGSCQDFWRGRSSWRGLLGLSVLPNTPLTHDESHTRGKSRAGVPRQLGVGSWEEGLRFQGSFSGLTSAAVVWESMATGQAPAPGQCTVHNNSCRRLSAEISASEGTSSRPRVRLNAFLIKRAYSANSESGSACSVLE